MAFREIYRRQAALLVRALPHIASESCFALKGGTAINLFLRDMPRLSVDIDLTYVPSADRQSSLAAIDAAMQRIAERLRRALPGAVVTPSFAEPEHALVKFMLRIEGVQIKVEVTPVLRGCVFEPELRSVSPPVEAAFGFAEARILSFADLYAGKIVAALDRQHPRDLYDIDLLIHGEGISDELRLAFLVYLISHNRPMAEILAPRRKSIAAEHARGFQGMTEEPVTLERLERAREELIDAMVGNMPREHRRFLLAFEAGQPNWNELRLADASTLPAVRWRVQNLERLSNDARLQLVRHLELILGSGE
jgi:hypothetical protein